MQDSLSLSVKGEVYGGTAYALYVINRDRDAKFTNHIAAVVVITVKSSLHAEQ